MAPGYIIFAREGLVVAQHFDLRTLQVSGEPKAMAARVLHITPSAAALFSTSADGSVFLYQESMNTEAQLRWYDRTGTSLGVLGNPGDYTNPRISPDGKRVALVIPDPNNGNRDLWLLDIGTQALSRFTSNPANDWVPAWSPDGSHIAFASDRGARSAIYQKAVNGSGDEELMVGLSEGGAFGPDFSPDGRLLAFHMDASVNDMNLWILPLFGSRHPYAWATSPYLEHEPRFSPDGRWIAYVSNETGANEVYVRRLDRTEAVRVSLTGGAHPLWRRDGRELFFSAPSGTILSVQVKPGDIFQAGSPATLFQACNGARSSRGAELFFDIVPDGSRFLVSCAADPTTQRATNILVNWPVLLKDR